MLHFLAIIYATSKVIEEHGIKLMTARYTLTFKLYVTTLNREVTVNISFVCLCLQVMTVDKEEVHAQGAYMLLYCR
jgi:hypothetical protein